MEYLPEKKRTQKIQALKKEEKTRNYREFLADQGVVLALVKYLLALRTADPKPEDPVEHLRDYFGRYRDPMWDVVDQLTQENQQLKEQEIPQLEIRLKELQLEIEADQREFKAKACYRCLDPERTNQVSTKLMIQKLSGLPKFDIDVKLEFGEFFRHFCTITQDESLGGEMNYDRYEQQVELFMRAFRDNQPPFQGDLENEIYKRFVQTLRDNYGGVK
eukprot:403361928